MTCNCNQCKGAKVDPHTRDVYMKKREFRIRSLIIKPSTTEESISQSHISDEDFVDDLMETNKIDINNSKSSSEKLNFLVKSPKKSKEKQNNRGSGRYPLVRVEQILYNSDKDQYIDKSNINDDSDDEFEDDDSGQHVEFDVLEYDYGNKSTEIPISDIDLCGSYIGFSNFRKGISYLIQLPTLL